MKNIKKIVAMIISAAMISSVPGMGILGAAVAFAFETTQVNGYVYPTTYDTSFDYEFDYEYVQDYVYGTRDDELFQGIITDVFTLTIGQKTANVYGEIVENDVEPIIRYDRTMLPARFVAENLGATVLWDAENRVVVIKNDKVEIILTINSSVAIVNGVEKRLDSPVFIENDRTYTPIRFIAENLGSTVEWDPITRTVIMSKPANVSLKVDKILIVNNLQCQYEAGGKMAEYNQNAVGGMNLSGEISGPSGVSEVVIGRWSDKPFTNEEINSCIESMERIWKQGVFAPSGTQAPFAFNISHPVNQENIGQKMYVLLIGLDANSDAIGHVVIEEIVG